MYDLPPFLSCLCHLSSKNLEISAMMREAKQSNEASWVTNYKGMMGLYQIIEKIALFWGTFLVEHQADNTLTFIVNNIDMSYQ